MKTIQMTLDEELVRDVDKVVKTLHTTRSAFTRDALRSALKQYQIRKLEAKQRAGYTKQPVTNEEFAVWEDEQVWSDQ
jgi:metal-responsive CopG/Arc/MetJ family transcriptional regulator